MTNNKSPTTPPKSPRLRFTPTAWAKLLFLRDAGDTEIGGFGVTAPDDLLLIEDLVLVTQTCTPVTVAFDDESVADFFDAQVDGGRHPEKFARIWIHTHPGHSAQPSGTDEATFPRVFGSADWAVMCILARGGQSYARLRFNVGPGGDVLIPVEVDFGQPFAGSDFEAWHEEYLANVRVPPPLPPTKTHGTKRALILREHLHGFDGGWNYGPPLVDWDEDWPDDTPQENLAQETETLGYLYDF